MAHVFVQWCRMSIPFLFSKNPTKSMEASTHGQDTSIVAKTHGHVPFKWNHRGLDQGGREDQEDTIVGELESSEDSNLAKDSSVHNAYVDTDANIDNDKRSERLISQLMVKHT